MHSILPKRPAGGLCHTFTHAHTPRLMWPLWDGCGMTQMIQCISLLHTRRVLISVGKVQLLLPSPGINLRLCDHVQCTISLEAHSNSVLCCNVSSSCHIAHTHTLAAFWQSSSDAICKKRVICCSAIVIQQAKPLQPSFLVELQRSNPLKALLKEAQHRVKSLLLTQPHQDGLLEA